MVENEGLGYERKKEYNVEDGWGEGRFYEVTTERVM